MVLHRLSWVYKNNFVISCWDRKEKYTSRNFRSWLNHIKTNDICVRSKIYLKWIYNRKLVSFYSRTKGEMTCLVPISYFEEKSTSKLGGCFLFMIFLTLVDMYTSVMSAWMYALYILCFILLVWNKMSSNHFNECLILILL